MDRIAIVILNWNGQKMMSQYLHTVIQYSMDKAVVYVADNASTDNSVEWLKENFPQVKIILLDKNYGFADGYNRALRQISSEYYVLLNSDIEVTPDWLFSTKRRRISDSTRDPHSSGEKKKRKHSSPRLRRILTADRRRQGTIRFPGRSPLGHRSMSDDS